MSSSYFEIKMFFDIFIAIKNNQVYISVPAYDIYDKKCVWMRVRKENIEFCYDKFYIKLYHDMKSYQSTVKNLFTGQVKTYFVKKIKKNFYENISKNIDRKELLKEKYEHSFPMNILYQYSFDDKEGMKIKQYIQEIEYTDSIEFIESVLTWFMSHVKHNGLLPCVIHEKEMGNVLKQLGEQKEIELNCRDMAVLLTKIFLAFHIKARYIECRQKEKNINNRHFIVEVYETNKKAWIAIDSSYGILFQNKEGELISLAQIREIFSENSENICLKFIKNNLNKTLYVKALQRMLYRFVRLKEYSISLREYEETIELVPSVQEYYQDCQEGVITDCEECFWDL